MGGLQLHDVGRGRIGQQRRLDLGQLGFDLGHGLTQIDTLQKAVTGGLMKPDEGRKKLGFGSVPGGDAVYLQQQNFSLEALAKRDAQADPFNPAAPAPAEPPVAANDDTEIQAARALLALTKGLSHVRR